MSATDELRRLLDARGVEYFKHEDGEPLRKLEKADEPATSWHMSGASVCAVPIEGSELFDLWIDHCTPEQAIAATLGGGECELTDNGPWGYPYVCSACGASFDPDVNGGEFNYCPNCGRKVVE